MPVTQVRPLLEGDRVSIPELRTPRRGDVNGTVAALRDGRALVAFTSNSRRQWFDVAQLARHSSPDEILENWFGAVPPLVVIACGKDKLSRPAPAGELYVGSQHTLARRAADALASSMAGRVLILSAKHGLLDLDEVVEPYDQRVGQPGAVTGATVASQLRARDARHVVALTPRGYSDLLRASRRIRLEDRLAGTRGMLEQRAVLARICRDALTVAPAGTAQAPA